MTIDKSLARKISGAYQSTYSQLVRFFRNRLDNSNDADDLSQDVFTLWLNRKEQTPVKESRAYLFKIANHVLIDHWRRNQRQTKSETSIDDVTHEPHFEQSQADPSEILEHQQRIQRLSEALETLPPRRREAFLLYRFDGLSQSEIAERMEISISMVEKHIAAALVHCKKHLDNQSNNS
ncbi:RNA polymerase sigma factor [Providencia hangzhouensis]|uniref:RNA polymerase sigma factor n=1 Tax=Providencia rettgeri TaxID=587 RepID=A0AAJ4NKG6_PRORE|nr:MULTISPECIES: RNA polymerase sigma factor [Providencia]MBJ9970989.1 RNA polymerase sigma factor [Providencia rettgeri]MCF8963623.1 putative RNA polymerase sigma factor FecI [Providencia rettgeri]QWQ17517.1 RNA polymerase sigma factor [Providencia rettgeri]QWQ21351.1 RNA polymerase sigma factor [Providencia rettgeri]QWQ25188.1 RNA polymerase sigma factor [Providencia rettgeri]